MTIGQIFNISICSKTRLMFISMYKLTSISIEFSRFDLYLLRLKVEKTS